MQQTAQRISPAIAIALTTSVFFAALVSSGERYGHALGSALLVPTGFALIVTALGASTWREAREPRHGGGLIVRAPR